MIKKINYLLGAPMLLLAGNYLTTLQIQNNSNHSWFPEWREKITTFDETETMDGVKDAHYKSHLTITINDLNMPHNIQAFEITSIKFSYSIEFVVFTTWYDNHMTILNHDELIQAWSLLENGKALSFWTEGYNTTSVSIDSGIHEIPSTSSNHKFGDLVNWYQIFGFKAEIAYKYLPETNDNQIIEEKIYDFFENQYLKFTNLNKIKDVLELVKEKIYYLIGSEFEDEVKISLLDNYDLETYLEINHLFLKFQVTVFGKKITKNARGQDLTVKLSIDERSVKMRQFIDALNQNGWKINITEINEKYIHMGMFELAYHVHTFIPEWIFNNQIIEVSSIKEAQNFLAQNFDAIPAATYNHQTHIYLSTTHDNIQTHIGVIIVDLTQ